MAEELEQRLTRAVRQEGHDAAFVVRATYVPAGGPDGRLFPPTFPLDAADPGGKSTPYVYECRLVDGRPEETVALDQVQSQNNRVEEALSTAVAHQQLSLPYLRVEHTLPTGRSVRVTSFDAPHRVADAYLRDAVLDDQPFDKTAVGARLRSSTIEDLTPLYEREPLSLLLGFWDSHRSGRQLRLPRLYRSEVFGVAPQRGHRAAGRMDPHNLVGAVKDAEHARDGSGQWDFQQPEAQKARGSKLSEIGHGNIAPQASHGGVTVRSVSRLASLSFAGLARLRFGAASRDAADAARVALAALALLGDRLAFARPSLWLRSGCELVLESEIVGFQQVGGDVEEAYLPVEDLLALFTAARAAATAGGLEMSDEVITLQAGKALGKALDYAYLQAPEEGE